MNENINSNQYWDQRFLTDWDEAGGAEQSRFFAQVALEALPQWVQLLIRTEKMTMVDWGCAEGDGTDALAAGLGIASITGVDFSPHAIETATKRYPALQFITRDWIKEKPAEQYDVVFSSNTLEHFSNPYEILEILKECARKMVVLVLPYRELERIEEHSYTFLPENIPLALGPDWTLAFSNVVDCVGKSPSYWPGSQILLAYVNRNWPAVQSLKLADINVNNIPVNVAKLERLMTEVSALKNKLEQNNAQFESVFQSVALAKEAEQRYVQEIQRLSSQDAEAGVQIKILEARNSSLQQSLSEVSTWAARIEASPMHYSVKKTVLKYARAVYRRLPLSHAFKVALRNKLRRAKSAIVDNLAIVGDTPAPRVVRYVNESFQLARPGNRDVVVFSVIDWHFRIQRPQQLARALAASGSRVFFMSNHFNDSNEPGYQIEHIDHSLPLFQIKLNVRHAPAIYFAPPSEEVQHMLEKSMALLLADFGMHSMVTLIEHAFWYRLSIALPNAFQVYDCMDHHEGFGNVPEKLVEIEKEMLSRSDLVVVTSTYLEAFAQDFNANVISIRNACEFDHFSSKPAECYVDPQGRKIIGYYGAIAEWFDLDLIRAIASAHAGSMVLLVGNDTVNAAATLADLGNVVFTGEVPYDRLPYYLYAFDTCILPFKIIPLTLATNPVKVYEYLAAGRSVVSVDLPEITQFGNLVRTAASQAEFITMVGQELQATSAGNLAEAQNERREFARQQTWNHRGEQFQEAIRGLAVPRVSAIVLTYNNLELTKACLRSVVENSDYANLEIVVVDNASSDGSPEFLRQFAQDHANVKLILNDANLGFAAGNNVGLAAATGDYLVLLNNDTVVSKGWVLTMVRHFQHNGNIGLLGPVTNNIGNEARIPTTYAAPDDMHAEVLSLTAAKMGKTRKLRNVAFFCVMMPRLTYEKCGPLCEEYGLGFFEDDDYCRRVEQAGMEILCADDAFVHHHLSASFNKLKSSDREALFERNKKIYEAKWGPWIPHRYN